ncbi:hypothetical protein E1B28_004160 [Marasmius oreades]|uniref:Alpha/beta hydrolase fold-3 domain-containing protein n=1 Tax=Marasmius oreades TaxID=181124 RepID=A0A9P8ACS9_9AGAR|nr:uncharacterized protein E1B28_004160 [Marasmius oreades]KAG7096748.1 hypothetical protein E1B28_004160 [Marasmius oreades]
MPVTTVSAAVHIAPVAIRTFFGHGKRKAIKFRDSVEEEEATDDIFFDEAFHIVKAFIDMGTRNTVESLQAFTNTHIPAPYWAAVSAVRIPLRSCNEAADMLIAWFGPDELKLVVGGERWWQVRGLDGLDAEWITEKAYLSDEIRPVNFGRKLTEDEERLLRMEELDTVMFYVHGGGYFWGSINTHRYQLIRYARKLKGRVFAVNYRKAPQYPWPCPLQDVIAAYLYLIQPPKEAIHKAIPPSKIVFAGDSAGGGICLSVLAVLRDTGAPMPAGAALISPWVDLTHSFPSVMKNTKTDIIPEHGFLAKPSTLWPIHPVAPPDGRIGPTKSMPPPEPGHADTLLPSASRIEVDEKSTDEAESRGVIVPQEQMLKETSQKNYNEMGQTYSSRTDEEEYDIDRWEPKLPKVLMEDVEAVPLELRSQIQLYATNEQLSHPLVSPILQSTLGGLPPLYIMAGDGEVLRDEIIYLAHRAASPQQYPTRRGVLRDCRRQKENVQKFSTPTKVHLQVFDGMCHVLPVFMFTPSAKHAYRSITAFAQHVTTYPNQLPDRTPFLELFSPPSQTSIDSKVEDQRRPGKWQEDSAHRPGPSAVPSASHTLYESEAKIDNGSEKPRSSNACPPSDNGSEAGFDVMMVRERVDIRGRVRRMEPKSEMAVLQIKPGEVGLIKEAPAIRWFKGQEQWDKRFSKRAETVLKKRATHENKTRRMIDHARQQGLTLSYEEEKPPLPQSQSFTNASIPQKVNDGVVQQDRRWGPLDLDHENPPPSAIAKRRDTPEAYALLRKHIYHTAPVTHRLIPRLKISDAVRAAFDPKDDPINPPKQSVSEQQVRTHIIPMHGLKMWDVIVRYFMRETSRKAINSVKNMSGNGDDTLVTGTVSTK